MPPPSTIPQNTHSPAPRRSNYQAFEKEALSYARTTQIHRCPRAKSTPLFSVRYGHHFKPIKMNTIQKLCGAVPLPHRRPERQGILGGLPFAQFAKGVNLWPHHVLTRKSRYSRWPALHSMRWPAYSYLLFGKSAKPRNSTPGSTADAAPSASAPETAAAKIRTAP